MINVHNHVQAKQAAYFALSHGCQTHRPHTAQYNLKWAGLVKQLHNNQPFNVKK